MISDLPSFWYAMTGLPVDPMTIANPSFAAPVTAASWVRVTDAMLRELSFSTLSQAEQFLSQRGLVQTADPLVWAASPYVFVETMQYNVIRIVELRVYS